MAFGQETFDEAAIMTFQEYGLRPGTENVPQVVGLGAAARFARERLPAATEKLRSLRDTGRLPEDARSMQLFGYLPLRLPNRIVLALHR